MFTAPYWWARVYSKNAASSDRKRRASRATISSHSQATKWSKPIANEQMKDRF